MFAAVALLIGALAHARLTRLVTADRITLRPRAALVRRYGTGGIGYAVHCRWCAGLWLALPVAAAVVSISPALRPDEPTGWTVCVLLALAYSHTTALLAGLEDED